MLMHIGAAYWTHVFTRICMRQLGSSTKTCWVPFIVEWYGKTSCDYTPILNAPDTTITLPDFINDLWVIAKDVLLLICFLNALRVYAKQGAFSPCQGTNLLIRSHLEHSTRASSLNRMACVIQQELILKLTSQLTISPLLLPLPGEATAFEPTLNLFRPYNQLHGVLGFIKYGPQFIQPYHTLFCLRL